MPRPRGSTTQPKRCLHKASGQSVVTIDGKDYYLGKHDSPEAIQRYDRLIAEWLLRGRQGPAAANHETVTIEQLIAGWAEHVQMETGLPPEAQAMMALRWLRRHYGETLARDFGAVQLMALRLKMAQAECNPFGKGNGKTLSRTYVNHMTRHIKKVIQWAARVKMVPAHVWVEVQTVNSLKAGKSIARDTRRVLPVNDSDLNATLEVATPVIAAMIRVQLLTGARCGEIFQMRTCDIDMSGPVWKFRPQSHKTQHHGKERVIFIGPKAQEIVRPFLRTNLNAYLFSPAESYQYRIGIRRESSDDASPFMNELRRRVAANPSVAACYTACAEEARAKGWKVPSYRTATRNIRLNRSGGIEYRVYHQRYLESAIGRPFFDELRRRMAATRASVATCYTACVKEAKANGWEVPSYRAAARNIRLNRSGHQARKLGAMFTAMVYGNAITRAIQRADKLAHQRHPEIPANVPIVKRWHSHQLRHNAATYLRQQFGIEVARAVLGHSSAAMTEIYAEMDYAAAERAMAQVG